ncbi:nucleotidyltransferase family protein [Halomonas sp.]|uniref:type VII toxin-antitoxin system MntA family adenylyltransferase antitoxin n=1 Tax=Halomonas sp. TaxID=1486246 RepID=UPI0025BB5BAB|nr:nucleotidyltransferase domain-containing protein [Halomonas sp.]
MQAGQNDEDHERHRAILNALAPFDEIDQVVLFGSLAKGTGRPDSDLDIAVESRRPLTSAQKIDMIEALALASSRPVDLVDLRTAGQPLLTQIVVSGVRLKGSDSAWAGLVYRNIIDNEDFVPLQQRILRARQAAWINP